MCSMREVGVVECLGCGTSGIKEVWDVLNVECWGCEVSGMWDVGDVRCLICGMIWMLDVWDVECWDKGCSEFRMGDVGLQNSLLLILLF